MFIFSSFQMIVNSVKFFDASKRCLSKEMSSPYLWMSTSKEVCVDDLSYFACQPPTVISKFDSHNYCSHITCFLNIYFLIFTKNCSIAYINTLFFLGCLFGNVDLPSSGKSQESFGLGPILPWEQWRTHGKVNCLIKTFKFLSASKPRNIYLQTL